MKAPIVKKREYDKVVEHFCPICNAPSCTEVWTSHGDYENDEKGIPMDITITFGSDFHLGISGKNILKIKSLIDKYNDEYNEKEGVIPFFCSPECIDKFVLSILKFCGVEDFYKGVNAK